MIIIKQALQSLLNKQNLNRADMRDVMRLVMTGQVSDAQLAALLVALRLKGESVDEITAAVEVMRELVDPIHIAQTPLIDTCGTGGDGANTFNISTTCAFVVAAAGGFVAKHGNRSVSSRCGSADVLEAAGVNLALDAEQVARCVNEIGVGFLFAPNYHGAMKHASKVRKELGLRTLFNLLGPLANPAHAQHQLIGVFDKRWTQPLAQVLQQLGSKHVLVVSADDGLDEISIASPTQIAELKDGVISTYTISPEQFGLPRADLSELAVDDASDSLAIINGVLNNHAGAARNIVLLNAGAGIYCADLSPSLAEGIALADKLIANGSALAKFNALINYTNAGRSSFA
jgi:anthranilate phosphoribosyltransferase